jgi:hypothetical protein
MARRRGFYKSHLPRNTKMTAVDTPTCLHCGEPAPTTETGYSFCSSDCRKAGLKGTIDRKIEAKQFARRQNLIEHEVGKTPGRLVAAGIKPNSTRAMIEATIARAEADPEWAKKHGVTVPRDALKRLNSSYPEFRTSKITSPASSTRQTRANAFSQSSRPKKPIQSRPISPQLSIIDGWYYLGETVLGAVTKAGKNLVRRALAGRGFNRLEVAAMMRGAA